MSQQHRNIVARLSEIRDDMVRIAAKVEISATDERHFHELDAEFKKLDVQRLIERELDVERIKEHAKDPRNVTPGFENGGHEREAFSQGTDSHEHRAGLWLASEPAIREASQRLRAQWGLRRWQ